MVTHMGVLRVGHAAKAERCHYVLFLFYLAHDRECGRVWSFHPRPAVFRKVNKRSGCVLGAALAFREEGRDAFVEYSARPVLWRVALVAVAVGGLLLVRWG